MQWFDAGVNLLDPRFDAAETLAQAAAAAVTKVCVITTEPDEWEAAYALYCQFPEQVCYTLGVHPHNASKVTASDWTRLVQLAARPGMVAVGECGLDFLRNLSPQDVQLQVFEQQLQLACELKLPVYLHERDAFTQQYKLLTQYRNSLVGGIAHCFTTHREHLNAYLELDLYIGITGWVCDPKRGDDLRDAMTALPLNRLILETDAPYLFPKNLRPRQRNNQPAFLPSIGEQVAELKQCSLEEVARVSYANAMQLFNL